MRWALPLVFLGLCCAQNGASQQFDLGKDRLPISDLNGPWRFHVGDNPQWAKPDYDDSGWKLKKPDEQWDPKAEGSTDGFAWYRFRVRIPADIAQPSVFASVNGTAADVYADGQRICGWGSPPPRVRLVVDHGQVCRMPQERAGRNVTFAVRIWYYAKESSLWAKGFRLGSGAEMETWARAQFLDRFWSDSQQEYLILVYLIGAGGLVLFLLRRTEQEYLWFGVYELFNVAVTAVQVRGALSAVSVPVNETVLVLCFSIKDVAWVLFLYRFLKLRERWPLGIALASVPWTAAVYLLPYLVPQWLGAQVSVRLFGYANLLTLLGNLAYDFGILYPLYRAARARVPDSVYLLITFALFRAAIFMDFSIYGLAYLGWIWPYLHAGWFRNVTNRPFPIGVWSITEFLTQFALLGILGLRFARSRRDEERMAAEMEAARAVQHVLIPAETPTVSGLTIETVYKPAGEVGGDFFQVIALADGGALVVIGDVSGKGMPAAMTVSLLVGTFRTLAHYTQNPAEILHAMNQRMIGRQQNGFVTCLVLRVEPGGYLTAASAGHLAPFCNGEEIELPQGLPLGLDPQAAYDESVIQLPVEARLTLMTDGVVEARAPGGELFGFDRTREISARPAEEIAALAQQFGQEDDITVLGIALAPVPTPV